MTFYIQFHRQARKVCDCGAIMTGQSKSFEMFLKSFAHLKIKKKYYLEISKRSEKERSLIILFFISTFWITLGIYNKHVSYIMVDCVFLV